MDNQLQSCWRLANILAKDQRINILGFVLSAATTQLCNCHQTATDNTEQWNAGFQILPKPYENKKDLAQGHGIPGKLMTQENL